MAQRSSTLAPAHQASTILACAHRIRVHFCPQHWLLCHLDLYYFEFKFARGCGGQFLDNGSGAKRCATRRYYRRKGVLLCLHAKLFNNLHKKQSEHLLRLWDPSLPYSRARRSSAGSSESSLVNTPQIQRNPPVQYSSWKSVTFRTSLTGCPFCIKQLWPCTHELSISNRASGFFGLERACFCSFQSYT